MRFIKPSALIMLLGYCFSSATMASPELAQRKACMNCHGADKPILGPSLKDIAQKYRGQKGIEDKLATKIMKGGGGVWKMPMGPMPAQTQVNPSEARQLVSWILTLK